MIEKLARDTQTPVTAPADEVLVCDLKAVFDKALLAAL